MNNTPNLTMQAALNAAEATAPEPKRPYDFPWPEIRDFISVLISQKLAEQSALIGQNMLDQQAPGVTEEGVEAVRVKVAELTAYTQHLNQLIEKTFTAQHRSILIPPVASLAPRR